ncbi:glycosyltransferase family 4 protein [Pontibacter sp. BT310]|uniref:Glycosyltransferase family 4 protein n=1 Tax=Pontibacter populi TaxID=890055 RepID=A0ABS6XF92_9BACT|nr:MULTISPECIES: glycosyltransferase family 1 protein [Pontibacter]MBJ6119806.1 glycosyltransferase family 4 protein [Pontibacter sp. BT310]MBR0572235.1 glycosyltransferase family 4 protein [Microvirga sp. STS03]MBW3366659.1 glycosyltransferase family 4 protein [Pontibacter populi]
MPFKSALNPITLLQNMRYARKNQGDVNHITGDIYYAALALDGRRTVLTIHDLESLHSSSKLKNVILQLLWLKLPVNKVKYVTVISEHSKRQLLYATGISEKKIFVIPNCVNFREEDFRPRRGPITNKPVLLQVGTKINKNLENLVKAIDGLDCKLCIVGMLSEAQNNLLHNHKIDFENFTNVPDKELKRLYYKADIVTFISTFEGFGLPILEANALGRPVITSNITAMPEVASDAALLVDPADINQIQSAIVQLISDEALREQLVRAGYSNVKRFTPEAVAAQYEVLYQKVISENA